MRGWITGMHSPSALIEVDFNLYTRHYQPGLNPHGSVRASIDMPPQTWLAQPETPTVVWVRAGRMHPPELTL